MITRRKYLWIAVAAIAVCVVPLVWQMRHRQTTNQVFVLEKNMQENEHIDSYWLNNNDVLLIHHVELFGPNDPSPQGTVEIRHLDTGQSEPVPALRDILEIVVNNATRIKLTPDRHSIRFWDGDDFYNVRLDNLADPKQPVISHKTVSGVPHGDTLINAVNATPAPQKDRLRKPFIGTSSASIPLYPTDPIHWIDFDHRISVDDYEISYRVGNDAGIISQPRIFGVQNKNTAAFEGNGAIGLTPEGNVLGYAEAGTRSMTPLPSKLIEYRIGSPNPLHVYPLTLPESVLRADSDSDRPLIALSPDCKTIAWVLPYCEKYSNSKLAVVLRSHHILPRVADQALWVSDRYGRNMRLLSKWNTRHSYVDKLDWTPDGRNVTFLQVNLGSKGLRDTLLCKLPAQQ